MKKVAITLMSCMLFVLVCGWQFSVKGNNVCDGVTKEFINTHTPVVFDNITDKKNLTGFGMCQILTLHDGKPVVIYADKTKNLVFIGNIFQDKRSVTEAVVQEFNQKIIKNNLKALEKVVAFSYTPKGSNNYIYKITDPDCPYCNNVKEGLKKWADENRVEIKIIFFPLPFHPQAKDKAINGVCAKMTFEDYLKGKYGDKSCKEGVDKVNSSIELMKKINVNGTPTFIGPKGKSQSGFLKDRLKEIL